MDLATTNHLRIKRVSELTGISRQTLISWERRHGIVRPARAPNGYRTYSEEDLALLMRISRLLAEGRRIGEVVEFLRTEESPSDGQSHGLATLRDALGKALKAFDASGVHTVSAQLMSVGFADRVNHVYLPLLVWIGDQWERGQASVAQEHSVSAYCRSQMLGMLTALERAEGKRVVAAGFPDETHENGLIAVAVTLALRGASVTYLGANLPSADVVEAAVQTHAAVVCQSVVMPQADRAKLVHHAEALRALLPDATLLALGGPGLPERMPTIEGVLFCRTVDELWPHLQ